MYFYKKPPSKGCWVVSKINLLAISASDYYPGEQILEIFISRFSISFRYLAHILYVKTV